MKGSVPQIDIVPRFRHLFSGCYQSLVVDAGSAGHLRRVGDGCRRRGGEKDRVNLLDCPPYLLKSGASLRLALGGNRDGCTTVEERSQH